MACKFSAPLSEEQIIAAINNDIPPEIADHLRNCEECRTRFEVEQSLEGELMHGLFRIDCPSLDKLRDYAFDILVGDIQALIEQHLKDCHHCRQDIASMRSFSDTATGESNIPTINRPTQPTKWPFVPSTALIGRTTSINALSGLRGRGSINGVLLEAAGITITLEAEQNDDNSVTIIGQFIVPDLHIWNEALVEFWQAGRLKRFTTVDDTGAFECNVDSTDNIRLVVVNRDEQVVSFNDINFPKQYGSN